MVETREARGETTLVVDPARLEEACLHLRDDEGFNLLLDIVANDRYPSATMLSMIEHLATPEERGVYARVLMDNITASMPNPSIPMMRRLLALS